MRSADAMLRMSRYELREHRGLLEESHRPHLIDHYNAHPEIVERLLAKAEENRRHTASMTDDVNL